MQSVAMMQALGKGDELSEQEKEEAEKKEKESWSESRRMLDKAFQSTHFDMGLGAVIVSNIVCIVVETDNNAQCATENSDDCEVPHLFTINMIFLAIYTIEASARIYTYRCPRLLKDFPFMFDFLIVSLGYVDLVLELAASGADLPGFAVLRIFRVARLVRAIRILRGIPELYAMVRSFFAAMSAMFWGFLIILMLLMMWAILTVETVHPINLELEHSPEQWWCREAFGSVWNCMLLFFQTLVAGDSWGSCAVPIILKSPILGLIFAGALITIQLGFTNLILAVIVEKATAVREGDKMEALQGAERDRRDAATEVWEICKEIDVDGDATITLDELMRANQDNPQFRKAMQLLNIDEQDMITLFNTIDTEKVGQLSYEEFATCLNKTTDTDLRTQVLLLKMQLEEVRKDQAKHFGDMRQSVKEAVFSAMDKCKKPEKKLNPLGGVLLEPLLEPKANQAKTEELLQTEFTVFRQNMEQEINEMVHRLR